VIRVLLKRRAGVSRYRREKSANRLAAIDGPYYAGFKRRPRRTPRPCAVSGDGQLKVTLVSVIPPPVSEEPARVARLSLHLYPRRPFPSRRPGLNLNSHVQQAPSESLQILLGYQSSRRGSSGSPTAASPRHPVTAAQQADTSWTTNCAFSYDVRPCARGADKAVDYLERDRKHVGDYPTMLRE